MRRANPIGDTIKKMDMRLQLLALYVKSIDDENIFFHFFCVQNSQKDGIVPGFYKSPSHQVCVGTASHLIMELI